MTNIFSPPPFYPAPLDHVDRVQGTGARIRWLRERAGITQEQLAKELGTIDTSVCKWESGTHVPSEKYVLRLARFFDVRPETFRYETMAKSNMQSEQN